MIKNESKAHAMWVASPSSRYSDVGIYVVYGSGKIRYDYGVQNSTGFRPIVCLKSGVALEEQEDGTYHIVDTLKSGEITFGELTWEGDNASVTVSTNTNFQIEYQKNAISEGKWTNIENNGIISGLEVGNTVYARLTDGINHGEYASLTINKN